MKVLVLGASGKTGRVLVDQLLAAGHNVTALVRNGNKWKSKEKLTVTVGDARDIVDVESAVRGQDAVICVLGGMKPKEELMKRSMQSLVTAAQTAGVRRVILLSTFLVTPNYKPSFMGKLFAGAIKKMLEDKRAGEAILKAADLDWTIVYATTLDRAPAGMQVRSVGSEESLTADNAIARADVSRFLINQLGYPAAYRQSVTITTK